MENEITVKQSADDSYVVVRQVNVMLYNIGDTIRTVKLKQIIDSQLCINVIIE